jgi:alpha-N-acetylglucosaminidase
VAGAGETAKVVPVPVSIEDGDGSFGITPTTQVLAAGGARTEASKLIDSLAPALGFRLKLVDRTSDLENSILLELESPRKELLGEEGYELEVTARSIVIRAVKPAGLFYGIQTLRQLLPAAIFDKKRVGGIQWSVPCVRIIDYPRFGWRGLLIDPARHFIPVGDVERFIDAMALHKFNRLQIHFTDDQGWRIEIKKYPKLTETGAWMDFTTMREGKKNADGQRPGGYYTQEDIRHLVQYAAERYVTIVPEIEMPAHTGAAIVSYPQIGLYPDKLGALAPAQRWTANERVLAPRPQTAAFMQDVLTEVIELFPSKYIHIGGDEANIGHWRKSKEMQALKQRLGCKDEAELHSWFIKQMDDFLTRNGRRLVGWDEIIQGGLAPGATVMSWRGQAGGITAAQAGHDVIMAPTSHTYFDYYQGPKEAEPRAIGGFIPLEKTYTFEPIPAELTDEQATRILGGQGQLWGEYMADRRHREYMAYPRASALSEVLWSPRENRNFDEFSIRLTEHLKRLKAAEVNYRPPDIQSSQASRSAKALVKRLLPEYLDRFVFEVIPPVDGRDVFEIESSDDKIVIRGNNGVSMSMGFNWYLKYYCRCHVSWNGTQLDMPDSLPQIRPKVRRVTWAKYRYFLNYCCFGYSLSWYDWAQWEKLIDWMALNGINAPLSVTGQEAVWQAVCRRLGMSDEQIAEFLAGPPYLPFQWMGCLDGWGGPLPQSWIDRHEELQKKILARQRELGMTPILQGFTGHVPAALAEKHPNAKLHQIEWIEWKTHLLDPLDPLFPKIAELFMAEQTKRFGTDHLYAADTFIEMTPPRGDLKDLADLSRAIYDGMATTDPRAVWVLQGWTFSYKRSFWTQPRIRAFLEAVGDDRMLVLDLFCETTPMWSETEAFCGKPWMWCNVQNFGNTAFWGGALPKVNQDPHAARRDAAGGQLAGLGFVNEGLGYNAVLYDLMYETAWRNEPVDLDRWVRDYAHNRYGRANDDAHKAWQILTDTVYPAPFRTHSVITSVPTLNAARAIPYSNARLAGAWEALLEASGDLGPADTYRFDLVNLSRQVLSNHAADLHREVVDAYKAKDRRMLKQASRRFLQLIRDLDELVATRDEFLLGHWLEDAKRWGTTKPERDRFEWNARRVLTLWGQGPMIDDYARKEWSGMFNGHYLKRWQWFLDELAKSLEKGVPFDNKTLQAELRKWMADWSDQHETYPTRPRGDSVQVAARLWAKYGRQLGAETTSR